MTPPQAARPPATSWVRIALPVTLGVLFLASSAVVLSTVDIGEPRSLKGLTVEGVPVARMTRREVSAAVDRLIGLRADIPLTLYYRESSWRVRPGEAGIIFKGEETVKRVMSAGRRGSLSDRLRERFVVRRRGRDIPIAISMDPRRYETLLTVVTSVTDQDAVDAGWRLEPDGRISLTPAATGLKLRAPELRRHLLTVARDIRARREIALPVYTVHPRWTTEKAHNLGIEGVLSRFRTSFKAGDVNRAGNVRLAAHAIDQTVVLPGETFSFNREVGPRIPASGYREAPVVVNGRLVPGVGGGVCQVSSTLYNAVLLAGLKTTRRSRHTIAAAYVPPGRDATVAYNYLDYHFKNNTDSALVVDTELGPNWLEVRLLGRPISDRSVEVQVVTERVIAPRLIDKPDSRMPRGQRVVAAKGSPGFKVKVWRIFKEAGFEIRRELISDDSYLPLDGIVRVGTQRPAGAP